MNGLLEDMKRLDAKLSAEVKTLEQHCENVRMQIISLRRSIDEVAGCLEAQKRTPMNDVRFPRVKHPPPETVQKDWMIKKGVNLDEKDALVTPRLTEEEDHDYSEKK